MNFLSDHAVNLENVELPKPQQASAARVTASTPRRSRPALVLVTSVYSFVVCKRNTHRIYASPSFSS